MTNGSENDREIKEILVKKSWQDPLEREMPKGSSGSRFVRSQMVWKWRKEHPVLFVFPKLITESRDTLSWEGPKRISESSSCPAQDTPKNPTESFFQALPELWQSWIHDYSPGEPGKSLHSLSLCPPACKILGIWTHSQPLL